VTVVLQPFNANDAHEARFRALAPALEPTSAALDAFYAGAYTAEPLGVVLHRLNRSPLTRILTEETFRKSFASIHEFFTRPGTFEFYLSLFRTISGEDVDVTFTVPAPGQLEIDIEILSALQEGFLAREIVDNEYVNSEVVTTEIENVQATLLDQDIGYTAVPAGVAGNSVGIKLVGGGDGTSDPTVVTSVAGDVIEIYLGDTLDGEGTAAKIVAALDAYELANAGAISSLVTYAVTGSGSNVQTAHDTELLSGGVDADDSDEIMFQGTTGITTQPELDALMRELRVDGIFTTATLTLT